MTDRWFRHGVPRQRHLQLHLPPVRPQEDPHTVQGAVPGRAYRAIVAADVQWE